MIKTSDEKFQERVDELLLLEKRMERKTQQLTEYNEKLQERFFAAVDYLNTIADKFDGKMNHTLTRLAEINKIASSGTRGLADYNRKTLLIFAIVAGVICLTMVGFEIRAWYLNSAIVLAKEKLSKLDLKLRRTPVIVERYGRHYVKLVPNSERQFCEEPGPTLKKSKFGTYAEMWQEKR